MRRGHAAAVCAALVLAACTGRSRPRPLDQVAFRARQQTQEEGGVRVTVAVPSADETRQLFGEPLYRFDVQPVWLEIENRRDDAVAFLPVGLDAEYYSPIEAANLDLGERLADLDRARTRLFFAQAMPLWVPSRESRSGFVFTRLDEGTKSFNVDVSAGEAYVTLTFFVPVPGLRIDHHEIDWDHVYAPDDWIDLDDAELAGVLADEPCCATDKAGTGTADPLNLVVIGDPDDVYYAFIRAGWDETETIYRASAVRTVLSFLTGGRYRYSPVSSLYVFGRKQDVAFQKARHNIHQRNHLRLWMSNARLGGKPVWLGQISRDIGVRFTAKTITTHKIDPDVDETREFLLEDLAYAQSLRKFGYAGGVGAAPIEAPRANLTGDPYFTDGRRLVLWVTSTPVDIADVEVVELGDGGPPAVEGVGTAPAP